MPENNLQNNLIPTGTLTGQLSILKDIPDYVKNKIALTSKAGNVVTIESDINFPLFKCGISDISNASGVTLYRFGKNMFINVISSGSSNGVTWTIHTDKTISLSGTATGTVFIQMYNSFYLPGGTYSMRGSGNDNIQMCLRVGDYSGVNAFSATTTNQVSTLTAGLYAFIIRIGSGTNCDHITLFPQFEMNSEVTTYSPYNGSIFTIDWSGIVGVLSDCDFEFTTGKLYDHDNDTIHQLNSYIIDNYVGKQIYYADNGRITDLGYFSTVGFLIGG